MRREASPTVFVCAVAASANRCSVTHPTRAQYSAASALPCLCYDESSLLHTVSACPLHVREDADGAWHRACQRAKTVQCHVPCACAAPWWPGVAAELSNDAFTLAH